MWYIKAFKKPQKKGVSGVGNEGGNSIAIGNLSLIAVLLVIFALVVVVASLIGMTYSKKAIETCKENCEKLIPTKLMRLLQDNDDDDDDDDDDEITTLKWKWPRKEKGEQGPRGPRGFQGEQGPEGKEGPTGANGSPGKDGEQGPTGPRGIRGERGPEGKEGPAGADGLPGKDGERGPSGQRGIPGERGPQGVEGKEGPPGSPGKDGERGPRGLRGKRGPQGVEGPAGSDGKDGERGPRGLPAKSTALHKFKNKHARVKISLSGTNLNAATIECGYGNDSIPVNINADDAVDIGTADIKNWYCVRIEKLNIISTKKGISVILQVINFTNDTLIVSILCSEETIAKSDILSKDKSELLNEPSLGHNSYRILRPFCPPSATSKGIVAVLHPGESCQFSPQFRTNTRNTSMLLLADSIHVKNSSLERYASIKEKALCGRVMVSPTFEEVVFDSSNNSLSSGEKEQDQEKRAFVEALSNPVVRLQTPTIEELNQTVGCNNNYDLVRSVLRYLKTVDPHITTDSTTFCHFFLEFLLSNVLKFLSRTGWEVDSLRDTKGCALIILTATARLAFSYALLDSDICNSFIRREKLTADVSSLNINGQNIQQLIEGYKFSTP